MKALQVNYLDLYLVRFQGKHRQGVHMVAMVKLTLGVSISWV
jgi:hypothetical protein